MENRAGEDFKLVEYGLKQHKKVNGKVDTESVKERPADSKVNTYTYDGMKHTEEELKKMDDAQREKALFQPKFLTNPNYYFMKPDEKIVIKGLDELSDTEIQSKKSKTSMERKAWVKTERSLEQLESNMD
jgi:hypothetical protein